MKRRGYFRLLGFWFFVGVLAIFLNVTSIQAAPRLSGEVATILQLNPETPYHLHGSQELKLVLEQFSGNTGVHLSLLGSYNWPKLDSSNQWRVDLDEAYIDYYGRDFDLRAGKQRINWGTALQINPTSYLNPINVADPLGEKIAVNAVNLDYYLGDTWKVSGVYLPFFVPAVDQIMPPSGMPPVELVKPEQTIENGEFALKLSAVGLKGTDFSLSYFRGKEDLPTVVIKPGPSFQAIYRDVQILGADLATTFGDVGAWAEIAYHLPKDNTNYYQAIVGADYGFENGIVVVGQYLRTNKDKDPTNLLLLGMQQANTFINWQLGAVYNLNIKSLLINPELTYSVADSTNLMLGARYFANKNGPIGILPQEQNQLYLQFKKEF